MALLLRSRDLSKHGRDHAVVADLIACKPRDHPLLAEDQHSVAEAEKLLDLSREDDQRHGFLMREFAEHLIERLTGPLVDAACRVVEQEDAWPEREPAREQHLLLISSRQRGDHMVR